MARFTLEFDLEAITPVRASGGDYERDSEIARILVEIPSKLNEGMTESAVSDKSGHAIGRWQITD
jgi:hypothetical protein